MKKINLILLSLLSVLVVSCTSKEEKANKLIKQYMYENLYDFESYEPTKTVLDTLYADIRYDKEAYKAARRGQESLETADEYISEASSASKSMEIWSDSYTSYGRSQWTEASNKMQRCLDKAKSCMVEVSTAMLEIKAREEVIYKQPAKIQGWKVGHKFRCKTKGGHSSIGDYCFVMDCDLKEIIAVYDLDDKDYKLAIGFIEEAITHTKADLEAEIQKYKVE